MTLEQPTARRRISPVTGAAIIVIIILGMICVHRIGQGVQDTRRNAELSANYAAAHRALVYAVALANNNGGTLRLGGPCAQRPATAPCSPLESAMQRSRCADGSAVSVAIVGRRYVARCGDLEEVVQAR
jgi:hypothetical protein